MKHAVGNTQYTRSVYFVGMKRGWHDDRLQRPDGLLGRSLVGLPGAMPLDSNARAEPLDELDFQPFEPTCEGEAGRVEEWRYDCLAGAGYRSDVATVLARRVDVELHLAVSLLESGCSQANAMRILL